MSSAEAISSPNTFSKGTLVIAGIGAGAIIGAIALKKIPQIPLSNASKSQLFKGCVLAGVASSGATILKATVGNTKAADNANPSQLSPNTQTATTNPVNGDNTSVDPNNDRISNDSNDDPSIVQPDPAVQLPPTPDPVSGPQATQTNRSVRRRIGNCLPKALRQHAQQRITDDVSGFTASEDVKEPTVEGYCTSAYPKWKENQCQEVIEQIGSYLKAKFAPDATTNEQKQAAIYRQFDLDMDTPYRNDLIDVLWLLYDNTETVVASDRQKRLMEWLNGVAGKITKADFATYVDLRAELRSGKKQLAVDPNKEQATFLHIRLALTIANAIFTEVDLYDVALGTLRDVTQSVQQEGDDEWVMVGEDAASTGPVGQQNAGSALPAVDMNESITFNMEAVSNALGQAFTEHGFDTVTRQGRKLASQINAMGFNPILEHNVPQFFWETTFAFDPNKIISFFAKPDDSGSKTFPPDKVYGRPVRQIRVPTPTADSGLVNYLTSFVSGVGTPQINGIFDLFCRHLQTERKLFLYVNLQKDSGAEGARVQALKKYALVNSAFMMLSFPMDGAFFKREGKGEMEIDSFISECRQAILGSDFTEDAVEIKSPEGYYFPLHAIKQRFRRKYGHELEFKRVVSHCLQVTKEEFFAGSAKLDVDAQKEFLLLLDTRIEEAITAAIRADIVCNTCKDAQDRGGSKAASKLYDTLMSLGQHLEESMQLFVITRFVEAAWFNKSQTVIAKNRGDVAGRAIRRMRTTTAKKTNRQRLERDGFAEWDIATHPPRS